MSLRKQVFPFIRAGTQIYKGLVAYMESVHKRTLFEPEPDSNVRKSRTQDTKAIIDHRDETHSSESQKILELTTLLRLTIKTDDLDLEMCLSYFRETTATDVDQQNRCVVAGKFLRMFVALRH